MSKVWEHFFLCFRYLTKYANKLNPLIKSQHRLVLLRLLTDVKTNGVTIPVSVKGVSHGAGVGERQTRRYLDELCSWRLIVKDGAAGRPQRYDLRPLAQLVNELHDAFKSEPEPECFGDPDAHSSRDPECAGGVDDDGDEFDRCPYFKECRAEVSKVVPLRMSR